MDRVREAEEGLLQNGAESKNPTKQTSRREELNKLKDSFFEKQKKIFEAFHSIVLPPIIWVTLADIHASIKNGTFETLLQLLKHFTRANIPTQSSESSNSIVGRLNDYLRRESNRTDTVADTLLNLIDDLRKLASTFSKKHNKDKSTELIELRSKFLKFIDASGTMLGLGVNDPGESSTEQCYQTAKDLIESSGGQLDEWCIQPDIAELHKLFEELNIKADSRTIAEPKTLLQTAKTHGSLTIMLKRSDIFGPFLETILTRFNAINERFQPDLDNPLHYATRNFDDNFFQWLQNQGSLDINNRNKAQKTALFMLCEQYTSVRQKFVKCRTVPERNEHHERLLTYRKFIEKLLSSGADFNICSSKALLPFEFLVDLKEELDPSKKAKTVSSWLKQLQADEQKFLETCERVTQHTILKRVVVKKDKKFPTGNFGTITVELLEVFLRFKEQILFKNELVNLELKEVDEPKVITLLLHPAVELNLDKTVAEIIKCFGEQLFATSEEHSCELKYRIELKGLLRKACESANKDTLALLVNKMDKDRQLINDESLLVNTLNRIKNLSDDNADKAKLLACVQWMAADGRIYQSRGDSNGNTALHIALKSGLVDVAKLLLSKSKFLYLGVQNNKGETPMAYASYDFYKNYLDSCVNTTSTSGTAVTVPIDLEGINPFWFKKTKEKEDLMFPKTGSIDYKGKKKFSSMDCIKVIAESKEHNPLLYHPVIYTYVLIEWIRYSKWHVTNLVLTLITVIAFGYFSIDYICNGNFSLLPYVTSWFGVAYLFVRELLQWVVFGKQYFWSFQNYLDISNILGMIVVLTLNGRSVITALSMIILALQVIQLIGSLPFNTISTYRTMCRIVALNVIKSLALFCPLLIAFAFSFYVFYNDPQSFNKTTTNEADNPEFNKFGSVYGAGVKILVMATGEFEAAEMRIDGGMIIVFLLFLFCVPMVIQNLINGLAISDIVEIRNQSESISLTEKVQLLAQFEAGVSRKACKPLKAILLQLQKRSPLLFFECFSSKVTISVKDQAIIKVKPIHPITAKHRSFADSNKKSALQRHDAKNNMEMAPPQSVSDVDANFEKNKPTRDGWQSIPRIPGLPTFVATLEETILKELLAIHDRNIASNQQKPLQKQPKHKSETATKQKDEQVNPSTANDAAVNPTSSSKQPETEVETPSTTQ
ncbi:uncharacterized protein LOC109413159 [Aedes albopictus]|uniref:Ion transport domain-containing protein n=1 Tax=Aedes albopictus TaxID=7160 RepID=A0ABM1ZFS2_AEDAL